MLNLSNQPGDVFSDKFLESLKENAPTLESLVADNTNCVDLSFVSGFPLKQLSVKNNLIEQTEDVIPHLAATIISFDISGNNAAKKRGMMEFVCLKCQNIIMFNGKQLSEQQVKFAILKA